MDGNNQITQWEYKYMDTDEKTLNEAGEKGWEALSNPVGSKLLMKRPKPEQKKEPDYSYSR